MTKYGEAVRLKERGNDALRASKYGSAVTYYEKGLAILKNEDCTGEVMRLRAILNGNASFAWFKAKEYKKAVASARSALDASNGKWLKAFLRLRSAAMEVASIDVTAVCVEGLSNALYLPTNRPFRGICEKGVAITTEKEEEDVVGKLVEALEEHHKWAPVYLTCEEMVQLEPFHTHKETTVKVTDLRLCRVGLCALAPVLSKPAAYPTASARMWSSYNGILVSFADRAPGWVFTEPAYLFLTRPANATHRQFLVGHRPAVLAAASHSCEADRPQRGYYWGFGWPCTGVADGSDLDSGYWGRNAVEDRLDRMDVCRQLYGDLGAPETRWAQRMAKRYYDTFIASKNVDPQEIVLRISSTLCPFIHAVVRLRNDMTLASLASKVIMPMFATREKEEYYFHDTRRGGAMYSRIPRGDCGACAQDSADACFSFLHGYGARIDDSLVRVGSLLCEVDDDLEFVYNLGLRHSLEIRVQSVGDLRMRPIEVIHAQYSIRDIIRCPLSTDYEISLASVSCAKSFHHLCFGPGFIGLWQLACLQVELDRHLEHTSTDIGIPDTIRTEECQQAIDKALARPSIYWSDGGARCTCCPIVQGCYHVDQVRVALCATCGAPHAKHSRLGLCRGCGLHYFCSERCRATGPHICANDAVPGH